ncbi:winged helix-turn-helix domain-containing protein [Wenzhouxiangella sp. AB-CW3]|uniref:winged helix-turn-helix domain-containing tetratricopeptide repeat protein n=1 Tax=Wenzhouxiangella sp. AB-CW3 TaxID=2771012 RepID=UPI00168B832F|nr:winged helix-turn-helix domain-containing protein [Wenzhouxiangella sp. AB-CW3]QOC22631.1 winged helix-turn-helix domain-containing protein [Wenzhouxiangella sp. AB-CW3]
MELNRGFQLGDWLVLPEESRIRGPTGDVHLTPRAMAVLVYLAEQSGRVVSRDEFNEQLWAPAVVTDHALTQCIAELRRALDDSPAHPRFIETVPKRGYRLSATVTPIEATRKEASSAASRTQRHGWIARAGMAMFTALLVAAGLWLLDPDSGPEFKQHSIAVLPFERIGVEPALPLADGLHHDLLTRLSDIEDLRVISSTSVRQYRDTVQTIPEIARQLGVVWVLEGAVQQIGAEVQLNAQLIDGRDDTHAWAKTYRRSLTAENLFAIQAELIEDIVGYLATELDPDPARARFRPTDNLEAYTLYLRGRAFADLRTAPGLRQATTYFRQAIERDENYALAWVGLADALTLLYDYGYAAHEEVVPDAQAAIQQAKDLDPKLAEAHASLGLLYTATRNGSRAVQSLERAVALRPSYAEAYNWLAWTYLVLGQPERALENAVRAVELDPMSPEALSNLLLAQIGTAEHEAALAAARQTGDMELAFTTFQFYKALALYHLGDPRAIELLDGLSAAWAGEGPRATLALAYIARDEPDRAREVLDAIRATDDAFAIGLVKAALGQVDQAIEIFMNIEEWDYWPALSVHFLYPEVLDPVRRDPGFEAIMHQALLSHGGKPDT